MMSGARRSIAWEKLDGRALGDPGRAVVGGSWRERMRQEHLAVGAFSLLARELAEQGCSSVVLSLVTRAACDEVRHAEVCRRFAVALLGEREVPARFRGLPNVPMHEGVTRAERVLYHMVEMCCMSETLTGVFFAEMIARSREPVARDVVESLLEDEVAHGRVGWAYLAERSRERRLGGLGKVLPEMVDRTFAGVLGSVRRGPRDDVSFERWGYLGPCAAADVYLRGLEDVILPGFEEVGVELGPTRKLLRARGWAS